MNATEFKENRPSAGARAQAAAWVARLHGPNRSPQVEEGFRRWMADDPEHAAAFEFVTDAWEKSARLRRRPMEEVASWQLPGFRMSFSRAAVAAVAVAAFAAIGTAFYLRSDGMATAIGEQRILTLEDGTRVYLNTDTRAEVHYDKKVRRVDLDRGEALFEVAKRPTWPFIVKAGDRQIRALGTAFIVRRDERKLAITLVEGKVTVAPVGASDSSSVTDSRDTRTIREDGESPLTSSSINGESSGEVVTLSPGQRVTFASGSGRPQIDRPSLDKLTAWQHGQVAFDNALLGAAVAEMNRYSAVQLVLESQRAAAIRVSGIFTAGDSANFAQAVARTYGLQVVDRSREIVLAGEPRVSEVTSVEPTIGSTEDEQ